VRTAGQPGRYYLVYFGREPVTDWVFELPRAGLSAGMRFTADIIDTWNMTVERVPGEFTIMENGVYRYRAEGSPSIRLPGRPWMAVRIQRVAGDQVTYQGETRIYGEA
ncbi:MAG: DUF5605 domain-containing protein, partial [Phycisphaerae bacterium]|nr:DUF5605 domain-containing protein [Phycisphaerae bacterium]